MMVILLTITLWLLMIIWLWHMHFGYLKFESIKFLAIKEQVSSLPSIQVPKWICEHCVLDKKHKDLFPTSQAWRAKGPLKLMHSSLYYVEVPSNESIRYFIIFIDDFTRNSWVYFLKEKSYACEVLKKFYGICWEVKWLLH